MTRHLVSVTITTAVNTATMCQLLRKFAALGLTRPITLVLDNARYQRNVRGPGLCGIIGNHADVPAVVLAQSQSDRIRLWRMEVHQTRFTLWPISSRLRQLPRCDRRHTHPTRGHLRHLLGLGDDTKFPVFRKRLAHGRIKSQLAQPNSAMRLQIASAISRVPTAVGSLRSGFMS